MNCPACKRDIPADTAFCPHCGAKLESGRSSTDNHAEATEAFRQNLHAHQVPSDDQETEIWRGQFSPRAMLNLWIIAAVLTVAALVLGAIMSPSATGWIAIGVIVALMWLGLLARLVHRRMAVLYRLTNVRFFYETGILRRVTDRIQVIQIDDVTVTQDFIERFTGVGDIKLSTSDKTAPSIEIEGIENVSKVADMIDTVRRELRNRRGVRIEQI